MLAKKIALGFGIAIVFPMMIHYGVSTFSLQPKWKDYQVENYYEKHKRATPAEQEKLEAEKNRLEKERRKAEKRFQRNLFFVVVPLGIIVIVVGAFLSTQAIGTGLMFGGIFSVCYGYFNYWSELVDPLKFASMLVAFVVFLFVGYNKIEIKKT